VADVNVGTIEAVIKLRDDMSIALVEVTKALGAVTAALKQAQDATEKHSNANAKGAKESEGTIGSLVKMAAAYITVRGAIDFVTSSLRAQGESEAAVNKLNLALANQGTFTAATSKSLIDYSAAMQDVSTQNDEAILGSEAMFTQFGLGEAATKRSTQAALDLAAGLGVSLEQATRTITMAHGGHTGALSKLGFSFEEGMTKGQKFEAALAQIEQRMGGQALAATKTYQGGVAQLGNAWDDAKEQFGKFLGALSGGQKPFEDLIGWAKAAGDFFGKTLPIVWSEAKAQYLEFIAAIAEGNAKITGAFASMFETMGKALSHIPLMSEESKVFLDIGKSIRGAADQEEQFAVQMRSGAAAARKWGEEVAASSGHIQDVRKGLHGAGPELDEMSEAAKKAAESQKKLAEAIAEVVQKNRDRMQLEGIKRNEDTDKGMAETFKNNTKMLVDGLEEEGRLWEENQKKIKAMWEETDRAAEAAARLERAYAQSGRQVQGIFAGLGQSIGGSFGSAVSVAGSALGGMITKNTAGLGKFAEDHKKAFQGVGAAINGASAAWAAGSQAASKGAGAMAGAAAGAKAGMALGPWGAAIGAVVGGVIGFLGAAARLRRELQAAKDDITMNAVGMDKLREAAVKAGVSLEEFMKSGKGFEMLKVKATEFGISLDKLNNAKNLKDIKAAQDEINRSFAMWKTLTDANGGSLETLKKKAAEAGISLQAALTAKGADQLALALDVVKKKLGDWDQAHEKLNAAVEKYKFTIEELGPKFAQQKLDEQFGTLFEDYQLLSAAGVSHVAIIERMGPVLNEYVNNAVAAGGTIPEAMRPVLEEMIKNGQLLDANGHAYRSVEEAGIQYAMTTSEAMALLIDKITTLVNALLGIPTDVNTNVNTNYTSSGETNPGSASGGGFRGGDEPGFASGSAGFRDFGAGTRVMLHGREAVVRQGDSMPGGGGNSGNLGAELRGLRAELKNLSRTLPRAVRDGVLLAG
jgi:hypothetical protein